MWMSKPPCGVQLNRNHPLAQGLVGCWLFNEGSGLRANDLSGNNNTGVLTNFEPMSSTSGWTGDGTNHGTSLKFNGISNFVNIPDSTTMNPTKFTIFVRFTPLSEPANFNRIVDKLNLLAVTGFTLLYNNIAPRKIYFAIENTLGIETNTLATYPIPAPMETTKSIAFSFDGSVIGIFEDGVFKGQTPFVGTYATTTVAMKINSLNDLSQFANNIVSELHYWNRALSPQEVQQLYAQPYAMFWNPSERIRKNYDNEILA